MGDEVRAGPWRPPSLANVKENRNSRDSSSSGAPRAPGRGYPGSFRPSDRHDGQNGTGHGRYSSQGGGLGAYSHPSEGRHGSQNGGGHGRYSYQGDGHHGSYNGGAAFGGRSGGGAYSDGRGSGAYSGGGAYSDGRGGGAYSGRGPGRHTGGRGAYSGRGGGAYSSGRGRAYDRGGGRAFGGDGHHSHDSGAFGGGGGIDRVELHCKVPQQAWLEERLRSDADVAALLRLCQHVCPCPSPAAV